MKYLFILLFPTFCFAQSDTLQVSVKDIDSNGKATITTTIINTMNAKQATLVSGSNIKTINGSSILGSGDLTVSRAAAWGSITGLMADQADLNTALNGKANTSHSHLISDVNGLQTAIDAKAPLNSPSLVTPNIGAATGTSVSVTGDMTSSSGGIGYTTGNGGTVTQTGNKGNAVTINKRTGQITTTTAALAAGAEVSFNVNNSTVSATDIPYVFMSGGGTAGSYSVGVTASGNGFFTVTISNLSTGSLSQALVISFIVLKGTTN